MDKESLEKHMRFTNETHDFIDDCLHKGVSPKSILRCFNMMIQERIQNDK